jgi:hypothetical protein
VLDLLMRFLGEKAVPAQIDFSSHRHTNGIEDPKINMTTGIHSKSLRRWESRINTKTAEMIMQETGGLWSRVDDNGVWVP